MEAFRWDFETSGMLEAAAIHLHIEGGFDENTNEDSSLALELFAQQKAAIYQYGESGRRDIEDLTGPDLSIREVDTQLEKELLLACVEQHINNEGKLRHFREDLEKFEQRATAASLPSAEVAGTFVNIRRILEDTDISPLQDRERMILALQVMHHAAKPSSIDQGHHDTCVLSTLEVRAYTRAPASASKLVADIATANAFYTEDNTRIDLDVDSLTPDEEAIRELPRDGQRSFASQIFAITAANVFWMRTEVDMFGNSVPKGSFRFAQLEHLRKRHRTFDLELIYLDYGERVIDMRPDPPQAVHEGPVMPSAAFEEIYRQITATEDSDFFISAATSPFLDGLVTVESSIELGEEIGKIAESGMLPAIIAVHSNNYPWNEYPGKWHALNVTEYMPDEEKVLISDQYGKRSDMRIKLSTLYRAATGASGRQP